MLYFVVGMPGAFFSACEALTLALVRRTHRTAERAQASLLDDIARAALASPAAHLVVAARHPGGRVRAALAQAGRPLVVVRDDPRHGLFHLVHQERLAFAAALGAVAGSCATLPAFAALPRALILEPGRDGGDPRHLAAALARHLGLGLGPAGIAQAVAGIADTAAVETADTAAAETADTTGAVAVGPPPPPETAGEAAAWWEALDPALRALAAGALAPWLDGPPGAQSAPPPLPVVWGRELFFAGTPPGTPLPTEIDITGRARCLLRGPGILLPAGRWRLTMTLDLSPDAAEHAFIFEAAAGAIASRSQIRPAAPGRTEAALALDLPDLPDRPLELTLATERPAFAGLVALHHVTAAPHPPDLPYPRTESSACYDPS